MTADRLEFRRIRRVIHHDQAVVFELLADFNPEGRFSQILHPTDQRSTGRAHNLQHAHPTDIAGISAKCAWSVTHDAEDTMRVMRVSII